jgi:translation elongation factor EF-1alpha
MTIDERLEETSNIAKTTAINLQTLNNIVGELAGATGILFQTTKEQSVQIDKQSSQIDKQSAQIAEQSTQIAAQGSQIAALDKQIADITRQWQAYLMRIPPQ